ncbi:MAG: TRAP transporter substrate-binding protein DctP [Oscillospiraceae bacterium]
MKKTLIILLGFFMIVCFNACSETAAVQAENSKRIISIATVQPEDHPISVGLRAMKNHITKQLGDAVEIEIYYNGIMGGNSEALELLQMGTLNLVATSGSNLESFDDTYKIFGLPYLFRDEESFRKCMNDEEFKNEIYNCTANKGIRGVAWFANGVNNIYSSKPIYTPEDIKGLKLRIQSSEANVKLAQGFGAAAVVMAYGEVYTALQNHVIDAAMNPEMALVSMKHGEVAKYYTRTEHQIFTDMLVGNVEFLDSLSEKEKTVLEESFQIATKVECEEWDKQINECIVEAEKMGVEFIEVDKAPFQKVQKRVREELLAATPVLQPLYDRVQKIQAGE